MIHEAPYGKSRPAANTSQQELANRFWNHKVDLVLAGDDHFYGRTNRINNNGATVANGTVYSIPNAAGRDFSGNSAQNYFAPKNVGSGNANERINFPMFSTIRFTTTSIRIEYYAESANGIFVLHDWYEFS
jgi:hypothetical protein